MQTVMSCGRPLIVSLSEIDLVDLQIAATGRGEVADLLAVETAEIVVEFGDVGICVGIDRFTSAAEVHHGRRWQRDLRRRACNRRQKLEIVDKNSAAVRTRELAGHLHSRRAVQAVAVGGMKTHGELRRHHPYVLEFQHEIPVPGMTVVLAVGDELQP
jgi:hypothetical protein